MATTFILINTATFLGGYLLGRISGLAASQPQEVIIKMERPPETQEYEAVQVQPPKCAPSFDAVYPQMVPR